MLLIDAEVEKNIILLFPSLLGGTYIHIYIYTTESFEGRKTLANKRAEQSSTT